LNIHNLVNIKVYLTLLNRLDKNTISKIESINLKNINKQIKDFSFKDFETITQINSLFTQNKELSDIIPQKIKKIINKLSEIALKQ
jgi:hypothetical protein